MAPPRIIAVDFDGTIVRHEYPDIGAPVPLAIETLVALLDEGHELILWTMRSDGERQGPTLTQAVEFCRANGIDLAGVNANPTQGSWTSSPKAYAHVYIDDAAIGCPLVHPDDGGRPYADWQAIRDALIERELLPPKGPR